MEADSLKQLFAAMAAVASIPQHFGSHILYAIASKHSEMEILALHTTGYGDRMVLKWTGDPNWLYEIELRPVRPEQLESKTESLLMERRGR
jgi:hypothetical protein